MPDEFPTLETVAAFGLVIILIRTVAIYRATTNIGNLHRRLIQLLERGERSAAVELCHQAESPGYPRLALEVLEASDDPTRSREAVSADLQRAARGATAIEARQLQTARARDLVAVAVLVAAVLYVGGSARDVSLWFFVFCATGGVLILVGYMFRGQLRRALDHHSPELVAAAAKLVPSLIPPPPAQSSCPICDGRQLFVARHPEQVRLGDRLPLELTALTICRNCGYVQGQVSNPGQLQASDTTDLSLVEALHSSPENRIESEEHEG